ARGHPVYLADDRARAPALLNRTEIVSRPGRPSGTDLETDRGSRNARDLPAALRARGRARAPARVLAAGATRRVRLGFQPHRGRLIAGEPPCDNGADGPRPRRDFDCDGDAVRLSGRA